MRKLLIRLIYVVLIVNAGVAFAKDKEPAKERKSYTIWGGFLTPPLVVPYDGPVLPRESTAVLVSAKDSLINSIDGQRIDDQGHWVVGLKNPALNSNVFQLKPGRHVIGISFRTSIFQGSLYWVYSGTYIEVAFDAVSGHTYLGDANGTAKLNTSFRQGTSAEGSFNPAITDITGALDEKENHNLDGCFKDAKKIYRISDWLAAREKAASEGHLRGNGFKQELQVNTGEKQSFTTGSGSGDK